MEVGCAADEGYRAGERRDGIKIRWIVCGGVETSCCLIFCNIEGNGDTVAPVGEGMGT